MKVGDLILPMYPLELCSDLELEEFVGLVDSSHPCLLLEKQMIRENRREYDRMMMYRVLSPTGATGWQCAIHFEPCDELDGAKPPLPVVG